MTTNYPLLLGNLWSNKADDQEVLFWLELEEDAADLRAVTLTFHQELKPVQEDGKIKLQQVPLAEAWPVVAELEVVFEVTEKIKEQVQKSCSTDDKILSGCLVQGTEPPLMVYRLPVDPQWLMPEAPYVLLVFRDSLRQMADLCLSTHQKSFWANFQH